MFGRFGLYQNNTKNEKEEEEPNGQDQDQETKEEKEEEEGEEEEERDEGEQERSDIATERESEWVSFAESGRENGSERAWSKEIEDEETTRQVWKDATNVGVAPLRTYAKE